MTKFAVVLASVLTLLAVSGCATPTHVGTGTLDTLNVHLDLTPGALHVAPDGSVAWETTLADQVSPYLCVDCVRLLGDHLFTLSDDGTAEILGEQIVARVKGSP